MIIYRIAKGAPLTGEDLDHNFKELELRLQAMELEKSKSQVPLSLEGDVIFQGVGEEKRPLGRVPTVHFNPRGYWQCDADYFPLDLVLLEDQIFCCLKAHLSSKAFEDQRESWEIFFKMPITEINGGL